jgi:hypothetical protein
LHSPERTIDDQQTATRGQSSAAADVDAALWTQLLLAPHMEIVSGLRAAEGSALTVDKAHLRGLVGALMPDARNDRKDL